MKSLVYIESSVISYLTARPSNDLVKSARQAITEEWWKNDRGRFDCFVSVLVEEEISRGNPEAAQKRIDVTVKIDNLSISTNAEEIAKSLFQQVLFQKIVKKMPYILVLQQHMVCISY